ncbi:MAG: AlkZ family DNA glycosylase [Chitinophaga sp.]|uniref:winged helix DNA-binding domain-containing protein n=1 Tax=Chitinophaga sp. TaxID=1869181 RepID=UPI001B12365F|nr:winged helix DNA-binding domain-containing protein [Chitinophaga sp.]MBO9727352.1 AlkZ family DNA glycosylase [Chitinophaga sp.]
MNSQQIAQIRLQQQQIRSTQLTSPAALVEWMGCIQAQDYAGAKWAIGSRIPGSTDASIEKDFNDGRFLRTHILRPTWHFVSPQDIRWMLQLTAPKIKAFNKNLHVKLGISDKDLSQSKTIIGKALSNKTFLTRSALKPLLTKAKINTDDIRLGFLLMDAELDGLICSGPRQGKQFTYALLSDRAPAQAPLDRDEAISRLTLRYFSSHGPATVNDFQWWSGLNMTDIKKGLLLNKSALTHIVANGQAYWFPAALKADQAPPVTAFLLPSYDEYTVAYKDRSDILPPALNTLTGYGIFKPVIVINGQIHGIWNRKEVGKQLVVDTQLIKKQKSADRAITAAIQRYKTFMGNA